MKLARPRTGLPETIFCHTRLSSGGFVSEIRTGRRHLREIMGKPKLTVNEERTRICKVPKGEIDFLGFTFGRMYSPTMGRARLALRPSKKSTKRTIEKAPTHR